MLISEMLDFSIHKLVFINSFSLICRIMFRVINAENY